MDCIIATINRSVLAMKRVGMVNLGIVVCGIDRMVRYRTLLYCFESELQPIEIGNLLSLTFSDDRSFDSLYHTRSKLPTAAPKQPQRDNDGDDINMNYLISQVGTLPVL